MKPNEALELDKKIRKLEMQHSGRKMNDMENDIEKLKRILYDLLKHLNLESYTEKVDQRWPPGHGVRERKEEDYD